MNDRLGEREALEEVRRLRTKVRQDSRGRNVVLALVLYWIAASVVSQALPRRSPIHWLLSAGALAFPLFVVTYLRRTSKQFGWAENPRMIARYILIRFVSLALFFVWSFASGPLGLQTTDAAPWLEGAQFLSFALPLLGGYFLWRLWYGTGTPWLTAFLAGMIFAWIQQSLGLELPWSGVSQAIAEVVVGYVCVIDTSQRLAKASQ